MTQTTPNNSETLRQIAIKATAQMEHDLTTERTRAGLEAGRKLGRTSGRNRK